MKGTIAVAGSLAQKPGRGGHTWVLLQYLLGFRRLGWDVLFLDRLEPEMCVGQRRGDRSDSVNIKYFLDVMKRVGLEGAFSLDYNGGERQVGLSRREVLDRVAESDCLFNIMGFLHDEGVLGAARKRVFLDIDPGFPQMWRALGLVDPFEGYDHHVSIGRNIGAKDCAIPTCGLEWITTAPPIVLDFWPAAGPPGAGGFTTIGAWRGSYAPVEYEGRRYGLRAHEFRKFAALPRLTGQSFCVALDIHEADGADRTLLMSNGWSLVDPLLAARDPWTYQEYIRESTAEIMIAKNMYVASMSGWFSDRSICYLASGRPVLAQDTGFKKHYPNGEGIVTFKTLEEAAEGVESISSNPACHARAARAIAEEHFDSDKVLSRLLGKLAAA